MSELQSPDPAAGGTWAERNYRSLKVAVIVMGILIVAGLVLMFATIVSRIASPERPADADPVATVVPADVARLFGPQSEVVSTAIDGNRLALVLRGSEGLSVVVVDLRTGAVRNVIAAE